ncbi:MAG TPA: hypothetical protein VFP80_13270 [Thermoanaerobaculia bacterium]|nr:hypothetical protein [Thermoanaerobaculia bacterium]
MLGTSWFQASLKSSACDAEVPREEVQPFGAPRLAMTVKTSAAINVRVAR